MTQYGLELPKAPVRKLSRTEQAANLDHRALDLAHDQLKTVIERFSDEGTLSQEVVKMIVDMPVVFVIDEEPW